jgi:hypothetical protein
MMTRGNGGLVSAVSLGQTVCGMIETFFEIYYSLNAILLVDRIPFM